MIFIKANFVIGEAEACNIRNATELTDYDVVLESDKSLVLKYNLPDTNQSFIGFTLFELTACDPDFMKPMIEGEGFFDIGSASYQQVVDEYTLAEDFPTDSNINNFTAAVVRQFTVDSRVESLAVNFVHHREVGPEVENTAGEEQFSCGSFDNLESDTDEVTPNGTIIASNSPYNNSENWTRKG